MASALEQELGEQLKACMRSGDKIGIAALRMVRTRVMERRTAKNASEITDEVVVDVIRAYSKQLHSSIDEYGAAGVVGDPLVEQMRGEIVYLDRFLPKLLSEAETAELVERVLAEQGIADPKMAGKATGLIMKDLKGRVDPGLVSRLVRQKLGA